MRDSIEHFIGRLLAAGIDLRADEITDALWLCIALKRGSDTDGKRVAGPEHPGTVEPSATGRSRPASAQSRARDDQPPRPAHSDDPAGAGLHAPPKIDGGRRTDTRVSWKFASKNSDQPKALDLGHAVRPLSRSQSVRRLVLDEQATAESAVSLRHIVPIFQPIAERRFEVALVIENTPAVFVWRSQIQQFATDLARKGRFRDVRCWSIDLLDEQIRIRTQAGRSGSAGLVADPTGRRLILLTSDCISAMWTSSALPGAIRSWARRTPVSILQTMPKRLWPHTALGAATRLVYARSPGTPNTNFAWSRYWWDTEDDSSALPIPITTFETDSLRAWARALMSVGGAACPGVLSPWPTRGKTASLAATPELRIDSFRAYASEESFRLACHLSTTHLTLPVMRLVQQLTLQEMDPTPIAEFLASGLIERISPPDLEGRPPLHHEIVEYDFLSGVRELLLSAVRRRDLLTIVESVSNHISHRAGVTINLTVLVGGEEGITGLPEEAQPFARVSHEVLTRFGFMRPAIPEISVEEAPRSTPKTSSGSVFISHSPKDDGVAHKIRQALQSLGIYAWVDSQELLGGDKLTPEIKKAIENHDHFIAVLSVNAISSAWVKKEIEYALGLNKKVIPVMLPGIEPSALEFWFGSEPHDESVGMKLADGPGGVSNALPDLLLALGINLPADKVAAIQADLAPIADLILELTEPAIDTSEGKRRATAKARLIYQPAAGRPAESRPFHFTAPLGPIESDELAWYLERYINWPSGVFQQRAQQVEQKLPEWGRLLYGVLPSEALQDWEVAPTGQERRFTIKVDKDVFEATPERQKEADEAATVLLSLPWELIHDKHGFLFQGANAVRVRRGLRSRDSHAAVATEPPLRVLLVSPRPEDEFARHIDHRASARPLVEALSKLGDLAEFKLLTPPTFAALEQELKRNKYHVVHFDGHGVYDRKHGLGELCFESSDDAGSLERRRSHRVPADRIAAVVREHRVPLFFLDACQTAKADADPTASVAGKLLESGVASVAAMSHSVLVETTRRFVSEFYPALLSGKRVGQAMLAGQTALKANTFRGKVFTGDLNLQDWFVPVLFQEEQDPQLIREVPAARVQAIFAKQQKLALGDVPAEPDYGFVGRSRELLKAERALENQRYVVLQGQGGEGKTTLAAELARWLVLTQRFRRAAFVKMDEDGDRRKTLFAIGRQLVPDYISRAERNPDDALKLIERALEEDATAIVFDNMESILPPAAGSQAAGAFDPDVLKGILDLCGTLAKTGATRIVFTSREPLPEPFAGNVQRVGRLDRPDAIGLVGRVLGEGKLMPHSGDAGESEAEIEALVDAVSCHARSLVLLAGEVAAEGVRHATGNLYQLMASLEKKHPGERERSLLASVELSLRRLPVETRRKIRPLGVFQGGGNIGSIARVLGLDIGKGEHVALTRELVGVGLAEDAGFGCLRFDPALALALLGEMSDGEDKAARTAWAQAMAEMIDFLYEQQVKDANLSANVALRELPNLLAVLDVIRESEEPERLVDLVTNLEQLVAPMGRATALERVIEIRSEAGKHLSSWSHASFRAARAEIERTMEQGRPKEAVAAAMALLDRTKSAGQSAYVGADYDIAAAHIALGRSLRLGGLAQAAIAHLDDARERFQALGETRMSNVALSDKSDCLRDIGRIDEAAKGYQETIKTDEELGDLRSLASDKNQLATVRMLQKKYPEALKLYSEVRDTFIGLCEPAAVATTWHQIGRTYQGAGQYEAAEEAYQESLKIEVQTGNASGEAITLLQLGVLYFTMDRHEQAVPFFAKAANVFTQLGDLNYEGSTHGNIAIVLIQLQRYDEAHREIERAIECKKPFGHAAEPWKSFAILRNLERAMDNEPAAREARRQAVEAYLAYRREGGESQVLGGRLCALVAEQPAEAGAILAQLRKDPEAPAWARTLIPALQSVLGGSRDVNLADDPNLDYDDAAELLLLIESLPK